MTQLQAPPPLTAGTHMSGSFFGARPSFVAATTSDGILRDLTGARVVALVDDFILGFRTALVEECGPAAAEVLQHCGKRFGQQTAEVTEQALEAHYGRSVREFTLAEFHALMVEMFAHQGWGIVRVDFSQADQGLLIARVDNPIQAGISNPGEEPVEDLLAGFLAGVYSHFSGEDLHAVQVACVAKGDPQAVFLIGLPERLTEVPGMLTAGATLDQLVERLAEVRV